MVGAMSVSSCLQHRAMKKKHNVAVQMRPRVVSSPSRLGFLEATSWSRVFIR